MRQDVMYRKEISLTPKRGRHCHIYTDTSRSTKQALPPGTMEGSSQPDGGQASAPPVRTAVIEAIHIGTEQVQDKPCRTQNRILHRHTHNLHSKTLLPFPERINTMLSEAFRFQHNNGAPIPIEPSAESAVPIHYIFVIKVSILLIKLPV